MKEIYLDNAASTPVDPRVIRAVVRAMREPGNPGSFNDAGRRAREVLDSARTNVARFLNARSDEVTFCGSGSDANRKALTAFGGTGHIITTATEHRSVLDSVSLAAERGWRTTVLPVDGEGRIAVHDIAAALRRDTKLVSVMYANNEVGTVQPVKVIAKAIREHRRRTGSPLPYFHVDASQAAAWLPMDVQVLGADLLTLNGAKIHGPRGAAALYVRRGVPVIADETAEPALAAGLAEALRLVRPADADRVMRLRGAVAAGVRRVVPDARFNGPDEGCVPGILSVSVPGVASEDLLLELDRRGIRAGAGSACTAQSVEPSHVLKAMRVPRKYLTGVLRISLSRMTTTADAAVFLRALPPAVAAARRRRS